MVKKLNFIFFIFIYIFLVPCYSQINYFNFFRAYQTTHSCPVNIYGLAIDLNYYLIDTHTAKLDLPVSFHWGLTENLETGFKISAVGLSQQDNVVKGISDILLGTKYNFVKEEEEKPIPSVSTEFCVSLPTGDYKKGFGTGAVGIILNWLFEKEFVLKSERYFFTFFNVGYKINTTNPEGYLFGNELFYSVGSFFPLQKEETSLSFSFGVKGINHGSSKLNGEKILGSEFTESYIFCGIKYDLNPYQQFFAGISVGIDEKSNSIIVNIGMMY